MTMRMAAKSLQRARWAAGLPESAGAAQKDAAAQTGSDRKRQQTVSQARSAF